MRFPPSAIALDVGDGLSAGKGGKNRRRGKNENETEKRELVFKEDGQGKSEVSINVTTFGYDPRLSTVEGISFFFAQNMLK